MPRVPLGHVPAKVRCRKRRRPVSSSTVRCCHVLGSRQGLAYDRGTMLPEYQEKSIILSDQLANLAAADPRGFQPDTQRLLELADGDPLLGAGKEKDRLKPEMQVEVAGLENCTDLDRERPAALIALVRPATRVFALQFADFSPRAPTAWAYGPCSSRLRPGLHGRRER